MKFCASAAIGFRHIGIWFCLPVALVRATVAMAGASPARPDYATIIGDFRESIQKLMRAEKIPGVALAVVDGREIL